ncbi:MAG: hypothetical protein HPM95_07890 [Alphaproteobacteria bacterium]|nr:hypothetical protein [Alphaproteobacteria bacterium]
MHDASPLVCAALERATARLSAGAIPRRLYRVSGPGGGSPGGGAVSDAVAAGARRPGGGVDPWRPVGAVFRVSGVRIARGAIACDAVTYPGVIGAAVALGILLHPVAGDEEGMRPDALEVVCRRHPVSLVVVMPDVQNPTAFPCRRRGVRISPRSRRVRD